MAGPCAGESREQIIETAHKVKGGRSLPGRPLSRTSPAGTGEEGLRYLAEAPSAGSATSRWWPEQVPLVGEYAMCQIGTAICRTCAAARDRNREPVLLKRGQCRSKNSGDANHLSGNRQVILCGAGCLRDYTRNTLDINAVPVLKKLTHHCHGRSSHATENALVTPCRRYRRRRNS
jgi:3-deoxy-7-phosphoheptulonate synthase